MTTLNKQEFNIDLLHEDDYHRGFLQLLEQLTVVGTQDISWDAFRAKYKRMGSTIFVIRDEIEGQIRVIGTASVFIEEKFIHHLSCICHIEDVVVDSRYRGLGLGKFLVEKCVEYAKSHQCYKIILDCSESNRGFYATLGFEQKHVQMSLYLNDD